MDDELYDVEACLRRLAEQRSSDNVALQACVVLGDAYAQHLAAHFPPGTDLWVVGMATLVVLAGADTMRNKHGLGENAVSNVIAFAGHRLVADHCAASGGDPRG